MKKVEVLVRDRNTLVLNESAEKGDLIDLTSLNELDNTAILDAIEKGKDQAFNNKVKTIKDNLQNEMDDKLKMKEMQIQQQFEEKIKSLENDLSQLNSKIEIEKVKAENEKQTLQNKFDIELKSKDEQIAFYKDLKAKMSTKLVGETLEQHCSIEFNKLRATAFKNAYFEKDNDDKSGSKGDFIYRETDENGVEIISIMFEMKNQNDETATKHKNEDFFKELDKDRTEKKCEYAVLVSLLEIDNELYNAGIVDVSYKYDKMYVVRPQCFIPIITLLRNAAFNSLQYKQQLEEKKQENIDITKFEESLQHFQDDFSYNYNQAEKRFAIAIEEIDKTITHLQKVRENLTASSDQLRKANNKIQDVTIKKLTSGNPTMREKFDELKKNELK